LARKRLSDANLEARLEVGSAYDTGLPDESVDVIFCIALIHHLDIARVVREMLRVLAPDGVVILQEPVRFSRTYSFLRSLLPAHEEISKFEHPLSREELGTLTEVLRFEKLDISGVHSYRWSLELFRRRAPLRGGSITGYCETPDRSNTMPQL
jgi:SAM-dependent methyltransferase